MGGIEGWRLETIVNLTFGPIYTYLKYVISWAGLNGNLNNFDSAVKFNKDVHICWGNYLFGHREDSDMLHLT